MLIYINDKIYETDKADVTNETERPQHGYFNEAIEYKAHDGESFCVKRAKFSNINDHVWSGSLNACTDYDAAGESLPNYFEFDGEKNPDNGWDIENLKGQIEDEEDPEKIENLKKELNELEENQKYYDEIIPADAGKVLEFNNIGMGANSQQEYNYMAYLLYKDGGGNHYIENQNYESKYSGEIGVDEVANLAIWAYDQWGDERGLKYIVEHLSDMGWKESFSGVYEKGL